MFESSFEPNHLKHLADSSIDIDPQNISTIYGTKGQVSWSEYRTHFFLTFGFSDIFTQRPEIASKKRKIGKCCTIKFLLNKKDPTYILECVY